MSIFKSSLSSAEHNTRPTRFGIRLPITGKRFACAFIFSVLAWLMQLGTFWLPIITGNVHYGHGVCIKLAVLDKHENIVNHQHHAHGKLDQHQHAYHHNHNSHAVHESNAGHIGHSSHAKNHDTHQSHKQTLFTPEADYHAKNQSIATDKLFAHHANISDNQFSQSDNHSDGEHDGSCDICFLLASLAKLEIHTPVLEAIKTFTQKQQQRWFYQQQVLLTLLRILPPTRAPPVFS